mgnify:CR=1 FL=1
MAHCKAVLDKYQPDIVVHSAGLANVEECEKNPRLAKEINVNLAKNIAISCNEKSIKLIHISTDHLFSGNLGFVTEEGEPEPLNMYAKTKLQGEQEVKKNCKDALVIRTNFFAWGTTYRQSFSDFIINKLRNSEEVYLFSDVFFTTILVSELCKHVHNLAGENLNGVYNVVGGDRLSKYEFGIKIATCFGLDVGLIKNISIGAKKGLVLRPKDMSLSNNKMCTDLGCIIPGIDIQLKELKIQERNSATNQVLNL